MASTPTRVLFVSSSLGGGGAERYVSTVLGELDRERFAPELCVFHPQLDYPLPEDVPLTRIPKPGPPGLLPAIWRLARVIGRRRPDIVVSAFSSPSFVTGNALGLAGPRPRWLARVSSDPDDPEPGRHEAVAEAVATGPGPHDEESMTCPIRSTSTSRC